MEREVVKQTSAYKKIQNFIESLVGRAKFEEDITGTMIDPMAAIMEVIGTLPSDQHIWLQYVLDPQPEKWNYEKEYINIVDKLRGREKAPTMGLLGHLWDVLTNVFGRNNFQIHPLESTPIRSGREQQHIILVKHFENIEERGG